MLERTLERIFVVVPLPLATSVLLPGEADRRRLEGFAAELEKGRE